MKLGLSMIGVIELAVAEAMAEDAETIRKVVEATTSEGAGSRRYCPS